MTDFPEKPSVFSRLTFKFAIRSVVILSLSVLLMELVLYKRSSEQIQELTQAHMIGSVNRFANEINESLVRANIDLETLSNLPAIEAFLLNKHYNLDREALAYESAIKAFFGQLQRRERSYVNITLCDSRLNNILETSYNIEHDDYIAAPCHSSVPSGVGMLLSGSALGLEEPLLLFQEKVFRNDVEWGYIQITYSLRRILDSLSEVSIFESGHVGLFDQFGNPIQLSKNNSRLAGVGFSNYVRSNIPDAILEEGDDTKGGRWLFKASLNQLPWTVVAVAFENEMYHELNQSLRDAAVLVGFLLLIELLVLVFFIKHLVSAPLNRLLLATGDILRGDFGSQIDVVGKDEIGQLTHTFNQMSEHIENYVSSLHEKESVLSAQFEKIRVVERELEESELRLRSIVNNSSAVIYIKSADGQYLLVNSAFENIYGKLKEDVLRRTDYQIFEHGIAHRVVSNDKQVLESGEPQQFEETYMTLEGLRHFISVKFPIRDEQQQIYAVGGIATDITERKKAENERAVHYGQMRLAEQVFRLGGEGILIADHDYRILDVNPAYERITGFSKMELLKQESSSIFGISLEPGESHDGLLKALKFNDFWRGEIVAQKADGELIPLLLNISAIRNIEGEIEKYIALFSDISEQKNAQVKLQHLAHHDNLTGLANRLLLEDRVNQAIARAKREDVMLAIIFIDLDNFKYINDSLGHKMGDGLLRTLSERLKAHVRASDTVARLGGDEFIILMESVTHTASVSQLCEKLRNEIEKPIVVADKQMFVSSSIGVAVYPEDGRDFNVLFRNADTAMYEAKENGKNQFHFFSPAMQSKAVDRIRIEQELRLALDVGNIELHYQPIVSTCEKKAFLVEALVRLRGQDGNLIPPDKFIYVAEEVGLIGRLGELVLTHACAWLKQAQAIEPSLRVSVNVSARQFALVNLAEQFEDITSNYGVEPADIELEITEGVIIGNIEQTEKTLHTLIQAGFSISLDDFGTGYSSLSYLKRLPIHKVKLDRAFLKDIPHSINDCAIVKAVVEMVLALDKQLVCEGIETEEQLAYLQSIGCHFIQGYYFSKPLPESECLAYLSAQNKG